MVEVSCLDIQILVGHVKQINCLKPDLLRYRLGYCLQLSSRQHCLMGI